MCKTTCGILSVLGRVCISAIFLMSAIGNKIPKFNDVTATMEKVGIPAPKFMLVGAIAFLILGSTSLILGYKARIGAILLFVFLALATYFFHAFWKAPADQVQGQTIQFMKNLGLMGVMLFIMANGSGAMSLDKCCCKETCKNDPKE